MCNKEIWIWNIKFSLLNCKEIAKQVGCWLDEGRHNIHLTGVNPEQVVRAQKNDFLRQAINSSDIVNVDGILTVWGLRLNGYQVKQRAATPDIMNLLLHLADQKHESIYLLGAEKRIVENTAKFIESHYHNLRILGYHDGFFEDEESIIDEIARLHPNYLFIALPSPMKEMFIQKSKRHSIADVYYGVGGAFDTMGGKCHRAPIFFQKNNIEWIWRVIQNPKQNLTRVLRFYPSFFYLMFSRKSVCGVKK